MISLQELEGIVANQRRFFQTGKTRDTEFRFRQLRKLKEVLENNETQIYDALRQDLGKSPMEAYNGELGILIVEINHTLKNLHSWMRPREVTTPLALLPSKGRIHHEPRGLVLIIAPWNYPVQLLLAPLIGAIAAGNCAILKPSELAPASSRIMAEIIKKTFPPDYIVTVEGGREAAETLLSLKFDYIFFTGSEKVGKIVAASAAKHLTPVTLELGGKSPCIVDMDAALDTSARRIAWGKYFNAGQSCVAPDYLLVERSVKNELIERMVHHIREFFGPDPILSPDYGRIINEQHFNRLEKSLKAGTIVTGGQTDREQRYIAPTIIDNVSMENEIMADEIFGPILPVLEYNTIDEAIVTVQKRPTPLSLYLFTENKNVQERILREIPFGGGCVNNTLVHFTNPELPFGGIGSSGMGTYHGEYSYRTFSHLKSIVKTPSWIDIKLRYPPYADKLKLIKKIVK